MENNNPNNFFAPAPVPYNHLARVAAWENLMLLFANNANVFTPEVKITHLEAFAQEERQILIAAQAASSPVLRYCMAALHQVREDIAENQNNEANPNVVVRLAF